MYVFIVFFISNNSDFVFFDYENLQNSQFNLVRENTFCTY